MIERFRSVVLCAWACALSGCAVPEIRIHAEPEASVPFLDGQALPPVVKDVPLPAPYYGTARVGARMPGDLPGRRRRDQTVEAVLEEPISPWLFPLDFVLEVLTYPFRGDRYSTYVAIELPERPEILPGVTPREMPAIRARAEAARRER